MQPLVRRLGRQGFPSQRGQSGLGRRGQDRTAVAGLLLELGRDLLLRLALSVLSRLLFLLAARGRPVRSRLPTDAAPLAVRAPIMRSKAVEWREPFSILGRLIGARALQELGQGGGLHSGRHSRCADQAKRCSLTPAPKVV
jgi:hypothetical protein